MFEPRLERNREEFHELTRRKWRAFLILLVMVIPMSGLAAIFPDNAWHIAVVFLLAVSAVIGSYEVRKTLVFRRDLRQQRESQKR